MLLKSQFLAISDLMINPRVHYTIVVFVGDAIVRDEPPFVTTGCYVLRAHVGWSGAWSAGRMDEWSQDRTAGQSKNQRDCQ